MSDQVDEADQAVEETAIKPAKVKRLDFGKKNTTSVNPIDQAEEDAVDESIAPLPPSTLTSALEITPDEADKFDDTAPDPEPDPVFEPEAVEPVDTPEPEQAEVDQAEGMDMTTVPVEAESVDIGEAFTKTENDALAKTQAETESMEELEAAQKELEDKINGRKETEKQEVCAQIVNVMKQFTVDIDYLANYMGVKYKRRGSKAKPKYRDPMSGKTWSGRGKTPLWIRGQDFTKFAV